MALGQQQQRLVARPPITLTNGPRIGLIEFFGLNKLSPATVRKALAVREGDYLPRSKGDAEERIDGLPGVVESHLEAVCCEGRDMILFVGIEEKGAHHFELRDPPDGDASVPEEVAALYKKFLDASATTGRMSQGDDLTHGHTLSGDATTRDLQEQMTPVAEKYLPDLRHVLRDSSDEEQRAIAAYVIAYAPDKKTIVDDLQFALKDPDAGVRTNAVRGLKALAVLAHLNANQHVTIEPTWLIEMLSSLSVGDRQRAIEVLQILTEARDADTLDQIRARGLPALVEMARWKSLENALPAFALLGRLTPLSDNQVQDAWARGDRESVIAQALAGARKRK